MVFEAISTVFFGLVTAFFAHLSYIGYYQHDIYLSYSLSIIAFLLFVLFCAPYMGKKKFFMKPTISILVIFIIVNFTYNYIFAIFTFALSLILGRLFSKKKKYTRIIFTDDCDILKINYTIPVKKGEVIRKSHLFLMPLTIVLLILTFILSIPNCLWAAKAFPVSLMSKEMLQDEVLVSGNVTASVIYKENAMLVGGFFDIETENKTFSSPCKDAGILEGDFITHINDTDALTSDFISKGPTGDEIKLTVTRFNEDGESETLTFYVTPVYSMSDNAYRMGINYYNTPVSLASTIQTMTFSYPDTGYFAATAHSAEYPFSDTDLKSLVLSSTVTGSDSEGLTAEPVDLIGESYINNRYGTFGITENPSGKLMKIAQKWQVHPGKATMLSSFEGGDAQEYEVYITGTYRIDGKDIISFCATDERIKDFGGVMRGMSGTPIIQDGRLAGAICNVDADGFHAYATYAMDMAHEIYLNSDTLSLNLTEDGAE